MRFKFSTPATPPTVCSYHLPKRQLGEEKHVSSPPLPDVPLHSELRYGRARDGALVPLTLCFRRGLSDLAAAPMLVSVYGAYGANLEAEYQPTLLPLLERGWVLALAHVRGGGELGPEWHRAGATSGKHRSAADLVDAVRALHAQGVSFAGVTAAVAESAGGLALGGAIPVAAVTYAITPVMPLHAVRALHLACALRLPRLTSIALGGALNLAPERFAAAVTQPLRSRYAAVTQPLHTLHTSRRAQSRAGALRRGRAARALPRPRDRDARPGACADRRRTGRVGRPA